MFFFLFFFFLLFLKLSRMRDAMLVLLGCFSCLSRASYLLKTGFGGAEECIGFELGPSEASAESYCLPQ